MAETTDNRLRLLVERYERLTEELQGILQDRRDVIAEAKAVGYDGPTFRKLIARRAMKPDDRAEADALLAAYEAALGMDGEAAEAALDRVSPDAHALATLLLAEQIDGLSEPDQAQALVDHVLFILDVHAEIRELKGQENARKKLVKGEGFDAKQISATVRWFEKVAKHGLQAMQLGEQTFRLYRGTVDSHAGTISAATDDPRLAALFTPPQAKAPSAKLRNLSTARAAAEMARRALNGDI